MIAPVTRGDETHLPDPTLDEHIIRITLRLASTTYVLISPFSSAPKHDSKFVNLTSLISNDHPLQRNTGDTSHEKTNTQ